MIMDKEKKKSNSKRSSKIARPVSKRTVGTRTATPWGSGRCVGSTAGSTPRSTGCSTGCSRTRRPARSPPPVRTCPGSICRRRIWPLAGTCRRRTRRRNRTGNRTDNRNRCSNLRGQRTVRKLHRRPFNRAAV